MNCTGKFLKVWKVEDKGNVKIVDLGDSRKTKEGDYENCSWFRCLFVGEAAKKEIAEGDKIEVTSGQIFMEKYNEKWSPKVTVFHFSHHEESGQNPPQNKPSPAFQSYSAPPKPDAFNGGKPDKWDDTIPF